MSAWSEVVAFWTEARIRLYTSKLTDDREGNPLGSRGYESALGTKSVLLQSVDLTTEFMVASTNRKDFEVRFFLRLTINS